MAAPSERSAQAPKVPRGRWAAMLHRPPTRFDALFHSLAESIVRRYWYMQSGFHNQTLRLDRDEVWEAAMHMARAFQKRTSMDAVADLAGRPMASGIFDLETQFPAAVTSGVDALMSGLVNYIEVAHRALLRRDHPDLLAIRSRLQDSLSRFLAARCTRDGELFPCLQKPAAPDEGYFTASRQELEPIQPSGNARLDAYRLNVLVHDADDAATFERKLLQYVKSDPMLAPEFAIDLVTKVAAVEMQASQQRLPFNRDAESQYVATRFIFSPTSQRGLTPLDLFVQDQFLPSERQKQRLARWITENVEGVFRIARRSESSVTLEDLATSREIDAASHAVFAQATASSIFRLRLVPWDDLWHICGTAERIEMDALKLESYRAVLHPLRMRRRADEGDSRILATRRLVAFIHGQFVRHFGGELAKFDTLAACRDALAEFHHSLLVDARLSDGRQFADAWRQDVAMDFPAFNAGQFAATDPDTARPAVIYDREEGMAFLGNIEPIEAAITAGADSDASAIAFQKLFMQQWCPGWLVRKIALQNPQRAQTLISQGLGQPDFHIERDLEGLLGKLKCPDHTLPHRPTPFLAS
jgi:hypothetical protein